MTKGAITIERTTTTSTLVTMRHYTQAKRASKVGRNVGEKMARKWGKEEKCAGEPLRVGVGYMKTVIGGNNCLTEEKNYVYREKYNK